MKKKLIIVVLLGFLSHTMFAESPYEISWKKESIIVGSGLIVAFTSSAIDDSIEPLTEQEINELDKNDINWFDRSAANNFSEDVSLASDILVVTCLVSPFSYLAPKITRSDFGIISTMYLETILFSTFLPSYAKGGVKRTRPFVYHPDADMEYKTDIGARRSFFSGHTTLAFSSTVFFATVYSDYFPESKWKKHVWGGSLLAAGTVGFLRYYSGQHFPTDVLVGAAVGSAIGYCIPKLHRKKNDTLSVYPALKNNDLQFAFTLKF